MEKGILDKQQLTAFFDAVSREGYRIFAPAKDGSAVSMEEYSSGKEIELGYSLLKQSVKDKLFPQTEMVSAAPETDRKTVYFGARPCDAHAVRIMEKLFSDGDKDPFFLSKRENSLIVSLACSKPLETCFCTAMGGSPYSSEGSDLLVFDLGSSFLFEAVSDKGKKLMDGFTERFSQPVQENWEARDLLCSESDRIFSEAERIAPKIESQEISTKLDNMAESEFWDRVHETCLSCGACTYLCPTCHCFSFYEEVANDEARRYRCWDTCQYASFTQEASGHNPRPTGRERLRQRIMHKFNYFVHNLDEIACVGCGRCVAYCPVNIDIREILKETFEVAE